MDWWVPGSELQRMGEERIHPEWVESLWVTPQARLLRVGPQSELPLDAAGALRFEPPAGPYDAQRHVLVGIVNDAPIFALDAPLAGPAQSGRLAVTKLGDTQRDIALTALALINWHRVAPHCGVCGGDTIMRQGGHVRHCPTCARDRFPRTDPAVITAILDADDRLLLAHNVAWDANRMSLVAGFVDAGESLEACCRREAFEEVGVRLGEVAYVASQPWPFPRSLMLGFVARAVTTDIAVDGTEIDHAAFISRADYDAMLADGRLVVPATASIAASLIGAWHRGGMRRP